MNDRYKYPRTYHCPWSPNLQNDDRCHPDMSVFDDRVVIVTEKLDGENTTLYSDAIHARSIDSQNANHPSRDMVKSLWGNIRYGISGIRICGENLYAEHSIKYDNLESYFYVFSIWEDDACWSWEGMLNTLIRIKNKTGIMLSTVPVIYYGIYNAEKIHSSWEEYQKQHSSESEGYVIRTTDEFNFDFENETFFTNMAKYVRKNHVQTDEHWLKTWNKTKINKLREK